MTVVAALYRFVTIDDPRALRDELSKFLLARGIRGTLLVAPEGINGTVAGSRGDIDALLAWLRRDPRFAGIAARESWTDAPPFRRTRVRLKNEIVTLGVPGVDPTAAPGSYVEPGDWNALLDDPDVTVIDTRNEYEVRIGTFRGAINPHTHSFRDFPGFVERHLDPARQRKIAMFCTGGIRCEKSTAYLKARGFDEVCQLRGGILGYLATTPPERSAWRGECFVFDERVTVDHHLRRGAYDQCHACRMPISAADQRSDRFVAGESCPHCYGARSDAQRRSNRERLRQVRLAERRGEAHLGTGAADAARARREQKRIRRQHRCG